MPPTFAVAITGHRPNRMAIGVDHIARRLHLVLAALRTGIHGHSRVAVSALAEGSDRLFATAALDLGYRLDVLLPFPSAAYTTTFGDSKTTHVYHALLARAAHTTVLPGSLADATAAYESVGRASVDAADLLLTVWDGKLAAGRGGTTEIIDYALDHGRPVVWIDAARDRLPLLLRRPITAGATPVPLTTLAARAEPQDRNALAKLAHSISTTKSRPPPLQTPDRPDTRAKP